MQDVIMDVIGYLDVYNLMYEKNFNTYFPKIAIMTLVHTNGHN